MTALTVPHTGLRNLLRHAGQMSLARLITISTRLVYVILVARALGAESYGTLSVALAWTLSFLPLTTLGLGTYLVAEVSTDKARSPQVLSRTLSMTALGSLSAGIAAAAIGFALEADPDTRLLIGVFALALTARGIARWSELVFVAYERPVLTLRQEATFRLLELGGVVLVLLAGAGALQVAMVAAVCWLLQAVAGLHLVHSRVVGHPLRPDFSAAGALLLSAVTLLSMRLLSEGLFQYPLVLARHLLGDAAVLGNVALAMQALFVVSVVPWALVQVAMPALLRARARGSGRDAAFVEVLLRTSALATAALVILAAALGPRLVPAVLGADYVLAGELLWLAMLMMGPLGLFIATGSWLLAGRRYRFAAVSAGAAVLTLALAAVWLIPALGPSGVFLAAAAAQLTGGLIRLLPLLKAAPEAFGREARNAPAVAATAAAGYGLWAGMGLPLLAGVVLWLALLALAALRWCLKPSERSVLTALLTRRPADRAERLREPAREQEPR